MIDLSSSTDPKIAVAGQVLGEIAALTGQYSVPLMVVGATARDILSESIVGSLPTRATADIDVAVAVPSWAAFDALTSRMDRVGRSRHRCRVSGVDVDVLPFGDVATSERLLDWGDGARMNVLGLSEAFAASERVRLPGGAEVAVPTVAGLTVLKLSAWSDRRLETRRDAVDQQTIIGWYLTGTFLDALYDAEVDLLEAYDFNPDLAAAHRLGRNMAELLGGSARPVLALLAGDKPARLAADMPTSVGDQAGILRALRAGLEAVVRAAEGVP